MPRLDDDARMKAARRAVAEHLRNPPRPPSRAQKAIDQRIWDRASEQERRQMLKDCGWL